MTEEEVVNVGGEEIAENGEDHQKIKGDHCNGDAHANEKNENGNVGDEVEVVADSGASDPIVTVDGNGAASEDRKVDGGESIIVKVTEGARDSKVVENNNQENDCVVDASADGICKTTNFDVVEREGESGIIIDGQNGSGSAVETENDVHVIDNNTVAEGGDEFRTVQNGVSDSEIRDEVVVPASDVQNDVVAENEICDDVDADVDQSDRDWEVVAVENGVVETAEEVEIPDVPVVVDASESVDSNVQENHEKLESEEIVEKNEIPVDVDGVSDVKECADEDSKDGLEKMPVESVSEENGLPDDGENGGELDRSGEGSGHEVIPEGEKLSDKVVDGDVEAPVDRHEIEDSTAVENEAETSNGAVKGEGEPSVDDSENRNDAVVFEAEPSNNAVESEAHPSVNEAVPSNNAVDSEAHPSISEAEPSKDAVQSEAPSVSEAEPSISNDAVQSEAPLVSEAEPSISDDVVHGEAEPSNNAVESEAHPSVSEAEPSISNDVLQSKAEPSVSEAEPSISNDVVQSKAEPSVSEAEPSNNAVLSEAGPSVRDAEPSNDVVQNGTDLSVNEAEPSKHDVQREVDLSVSEAGPSNDAVQTEADPSVSEAEPSNDAVQTEADPSVSEADPSVSEAEPSNNIVQSEGDLSVDVPESKTDAVSSKAEPLVEGESSNQADDDSITAQEGSVADTLDGQNTVTEVVKRPFYYLIRVPRYDDSENLKEQIRNALREVEEKTKIRDVIRGESQTKKATCKEYGQEVRAAIAEERAARDLLKAKRQEMDSVQSTMNRLNNAISVGDIDSEIRNIEHMIQHETRPLKEEKQLLRQIQQLKQNRDGLSTIMAKQDQSQSLDDKVSIEEKSKQLQLLKKELDMLRNNVQKTDAVTKAAKKKYDEECSQLNEVLARFKEADDTRQEAFVKLHTLKKQLHEKSKYFWEYRNAATKGQELAAQGKREELQSFCVDQAERIMKMWNNNDEFRRDYTRCNTRSTLRRLQTLDGRSLGPDEEPPVIPNAFTERAPKIDSLVSQSTPEQEKKSISTDSVNKKDEPVSKVAAVQVTEKSQTAKAKKPAKPAASQKSVVPVARWGDEPDEDTIEEPVRTKEEEERILKAEKARKEEEEAKLKEIRRLEEIEKAKEALQRKKRNAEKAQQRAAYKAQKEAEQREKEREKRAKKKEKRKTVTSDDVVDNNTEQEYATSTEILTRAAEESDQNEKPVEVTKRPQKPPQFMKQNKVKSLPMSIRNRGKRRIQPWMWILIAVLAVVALFYMGNNSSLRSSLRSFGF